MENKKYKVVIAQSGKLDVKEKKKLKTNIKMEVKIQAKLAK